MKESCIHLWSLVGNSEASAASGDDEVDGRWPFCPLHDLLLYIENLVSHDSLVRDFPFASPVFFYDAA